MSERTICQEIAADGAGLMSLPPGAPERVRAEEHARGHEPCARALDEGRQLMALIEGKPLPAPSPAVLSRASDAVLAEADREAATRAGLAAFASIIAAWALPLALFRAPLESGLPFTLSLALMLLAVTAAFATVAWSVRAAAVFPVLSAAMALLAGRGGALEPAVGLHCASIEAMTAVGGGVAAWLIARGLSRARGDRALSPMPRPVSLEVAAVGGGALAGHAALNLGCSASAELPHLLAFHTGPVALAVGLALVLASATARRAAASRA